MSFGTDLVDPDYTAIAKAARLFGVRVEKAARLFGVRVEKAAMVSRMAATFV
jgi:hypothetical protein